MHYQNMLEGVFLSRPNRFIAMVEIDGVSRKVHVKNTGRCKELLIPGTKVWLEEGSNPNRKTKYSLICVEKKTESGTVPVNIDSQAPNVVVKEWLDLHAEEFGLSLVRPETFYKDSRFDFYLEWQDGTKGYLEVKGVTLDEGGIARFPDAPTDRGVRHIQHLIEGQKDGLRNGIIFVIQMKGIRHLEPNDRTHPAFGDALRLAEEEGVKILAVDCQVTKDSLVIDKRIPVHTGRKQEE